MSQKFGTAATGGNGKRVKNDFYETPIEATEALAAGYSHYFSKSVWEPACGAGKMARVLEAYGFVVAGTDLVDRGYGVGGIDFLSYGETLPAHNSGRTIITNPPFALADHSIRKAMSFEPRFFALLLKQTFWNAGNRTDLWREFPPKDFRPLAWRLDFTGGGAPTMDCAWCIWGSAVPPGRGEPMRKPASLLSEMLE
jgi:hypothetical protein